MVANTMKKALVLVGGVLVYLWTLQLGRDAAMAQLDYLNHLYASAQTAGIQKMTPQP